MSLQRDELYEFAAKVSAGALIAAGLMYLAVAGMNLAVLPAAFVDAEAWGTKVICGASFALMVAFLALGGFLAVALFNRALIRWFLAAGTALLLAIIGGSVAFTSMVHDSVIGDGVFMGCNVLFGLVLVVALAAVALMQCGSVGNILAKKPAQRVASKIGSVAAATARAVKTTGADSKASPNNAEGALDPLSVAGSGNAALRARARARKVRFQRARKSR